MEKLYYTNVMLQLIRGSYTIPYDAVWVTEKPLQDLVDKGETFSYLQARWGGGEVRRSEYKKGRICQELVKIRLELTRCEKDNLFKQINNRLGILERDLKEKKELAARIMGRRKG